MLKASPLNVTLRYKCPLLLPLIQHCIEGPTLTRQKESTIFGKEETKKISLFADVVLMYLEKS